jgi:Cof subfamily protein (haloacid dehalogenase superfamily)
MIVKDTLISKLKVPLILYNGSVIIHNNTYSIMKQKFIDFESVKEILNILNRHKKVTIYSYYYVDNLLNTYEVVKGFNFSRTNLPEKDFNGQIIQWVDSSFTDAILENNYAPSAILIDITKCLIDEQIKIKEHMATFSNITITASTSSYIEVRPKNSNKGVALKTLLEYYEIEKSEILSIGDNDNDIEMLEYSGVGITVSSGSEKAKESSDFITVGGAYHGVSDILKKVIEIKSK